MNKNSTRTFPEFSLSRLLKTVFEPKPGQRIGILIDLADPKQIEGFAFLKDAALTIQRHAHDVFYQGLKNGVMAELGLRGGEMFEEVWVAHLHLQCGRECSRRALPRNRALSRRAHLLRGKRSDVYQQPFVRHPHAE